MEARSDYRGVGALEEERLARLDYKFSELSGLSPQDARNLLDAVTVLFLEHYICYRAATDTGQTLLIFPSLVRQAPPSMSDAKTVEDTRYLVTEMAERLYATTAVLLSYSDAFTLTAHWQDQSQYESARGEVCGFRVVRRREAETSFVLYFGSQISEQTRSHFQKLFENLLATRGVKFKKQSPVICQNCGHRMEGAAIAAASSRGRSFVFCPECGEKVIIPKTYTYAPSGEFEGEFDSGWLDREEEVWLRFRAKFEASLVWVKALVRDRGPKPRRPSLFINYPGGTEEHERWVLRLINDLKNAGLDVVNPGLFSSPTSDSSRDATVIMRADFILVIGIPPPGEPQGSHPGRDLETSLIQQRAMSERKGRQAILPILLEGTVETAFPPLLQDKIYSDFRWEEDYFGRLFDLILMLYQIPLHDPAIADLREGLVASE